MPEAGRGLSYPFAEPPAPGVPFTVAPGIEWLRVPLPFALNHINLWLIKDGPDVTIVDCGIVDAPTRALWQSLFDGPLAGRRVSKVIVTHCHPDHIGNAAWLCDRFGVFLHIAQAEYLTAHAAADQRGGHTDQAALDLFLAHGLDPQLLDGMRDARGGGYRRLVPELPMRYHRIEAGGTVQIDGEAWELLGGQGHAPEHILLHRRSDRTLISGDMVLPRISTNVSVHAPQPDADPLGEFLRSIDTYRTLHPATLVLPSHGLPFYGLHHRIDELAAHHAERLAELWDACAQPRTAAELMPVLFRRPLDGHQIWFAMGETLAHLNRLVVVGRLRQIGMRFVRVEADSQQDAPGRA